MLGVDPIGIECQLQLRMKKIVGVSVYPVLFDHVAKVLLEIRKAFEITPVADAEIAAPVVSQLPLPLSPQVVRCIVQIAEILEFIFGDIGFGDEFLAALPQFIFSARAEPINDVRLVRCSDSRLCIDRV